MATPQGTRGWTIGHLWGARIVLHPTTFIFFALVAFLFVTNEKAESAGVNVAKGLVFAGIFVVSVLIHEVSHALAARVFKREVKEIVITLIGGHTTFDARNLTPAVSGVTAAAGPVANAIVGLLALGLSDLNLTRGLYEVAVVFAVANLILAAFNALPGTPLDGGSVLEAIVWGVTGRRTTGMRAAAWGGRAVAIAYLGYVLYSNFGPGKTADVLDLVWAFLILSILWPAASTGLKAARLIDRLKDMSVVRIMAGAVGVPHDSTLDAAIDVARTAGCEEIVVLSSDSEPAGHFSLATAGEVPPDRVGATGLSAVTIPIPRGAIVGLTLTGQELLASVREWWGKADALAVVDEGEVVGIVRLAEVARHLG